MWSWEPEEPGLFGALACQLHITDNFTLGAGQEPMRRCRSDDTTTVEVDEASVLAAGEDDAPVEGVAALLGDEAETPLEIERITLSGEMTPQAPAGRIADLQFLDESRVVHSAPFKIPQCLRVAVELLLIESRSLLQHWAGSTRGLC